MLRNSLAQGCARQMRIQTLFVWLIAGATMHASGVTLLEDARRATISDDSGTTTFMPPEPFAFWSSSLQTSRVLPAEFLGIGSGSGESDLSVTLTESIFDVTFSVDMATDILLEGTLTGQDGSFGFGQATVQLLAVDDTDSDLIYANSGGSGNFVTFLFGTTLAAGDYQLLLRTMITPGGFGTAAEWTFRANFAPLPVPLPAGLWLFAAALAGLGSVRAMKTPAVLALTHH